MGHSKNKKIKVCEAQVKAVYVTCECGKDVIVEPQSHDFRASNNPCEMCGSHGMIAMDYKCPECKQNLTVCFKEW